MLCICACLLTGIIVAGKPRTDPEEERLKLMADIERVRTPALLYLALPVSCIDSLPRVRDFMPVSYLMSGDIFCQVRKRRHDRELEVEEMERLR